jgi:hypothetical protein
VPWCRRRTVAAAIAVAVVTLGDGTENSGAGTKQGS